METLDCRSTRNHVSECLTRWLCEPNVHGNNGGRTEQHYGPLHFTMALQMLMLLTIYWDGLRRLDPRLTRH